MEMITNISVLGWEERALLGFYESAKSMAFNHHILIIYEDYLDVTQPTLDKIIEYCDKNNIALTKCLFKESSAVHIWSVLRDLFCDTERLGSIILDITTMPREVLWTSLFFLKQSSDNIQFCYHKPMQYADDWLSREPDNPRLLLKHSGIMAFGKPTMLVIITGFDPERTRQLINFYEPKRTILFLQVGNQFDNDSRNTTESHLKECIGITDYEYYPIDAYSEDFGFSTIASILNKYVEDYNIVATSLGPKLTGLSLYRYNHLNDSIGLTYVPCKEYNLSYSKGYLSTERGYVQLNRI